MSSSPPSTMRSLVPKRAKFAIVASRFNGAIVDALLTACVARLQEMGVKSIETYQVPGAFELPLAAKVLAETRKFSAVICLGAVIRGDTPHFDFVAGEAARGIQTVALSQSMPVIFGVLTTDTEDQARQRAGGSHGNAGERAAEAAVEMAALLARACEDNLQRSTMGEEMIERNMIERVTFTNFKLLRHAALPLAPFTLLIGANASGKSTALDAMRLAAVGQNLVDPGSCRWAGDARSVERSIEVAFEFSAPLDGVVCRVVFNPMCVEITRAGEVLFADAPEIAQVKALLAGLRGFKLDARQIAGPVALRETTELQPDGAGLAGLLWQLRESEPQRFAALQAELAEWMPEYEGVALTEPSPAHAAVELRVKQSGRTIAADQLSDGTLYVLAILTLSHLPHPPTVLTIEEPDRGIHPRLLRHLQDALYRLSYPADHGEDRPPCQVIATTHSPYFLDLFKDHLEEVVIAEHHGSDGEANTMETTFARLSDQPDIAEILQGAPLGEAWFSGLLSK